jgi:hypothetical protein
MINKAKLQTLIQAFISILILMTLFVASAHATSCHKPEQDTPQFNHEHISVHDVSSNNATVEASVAQSNSSQCCMGICNVICNTHSIPNDALLISHSLDNKRLIIPITKYYLDSELEDTHKNIKLQNYYRSSHPTTSSSTLQTTLKHRVLHI